ncbi:hypothetical protein QE397_003417 [Rhodococcus sp. SORGH_AS 301]|nr:hypothetical protein [Rhodococcus sp. SORGH_AS_0301]
MQRWKAGSVAVVLFAASCAPATSPDPALPPVPAFDADLPAVTAAFLDAESATVPSPADAMTSITDAGFEAVRVTVRWSSVEPVRGEFDWERVDATIHAARERGLAVLGVVTWAPSWAVPPDYRATAHPAPSDPAMFAQFASLAAERFRGSVQAWEVWNEPNISAAFGPNVDPEKYCRILTATHDAIERADPDATVVAGGLSPAVDSTSTLAPATFVRALYLCAAGSFDAIAMHPYSTPELLSATTASGSAADIAAVRAVMVENGDDDARIWFTEFGAPTAASSPGVSEARQAEIIGDGVAYLRSLDFAGPTFVFDFQDLDSGEANPEYNYGILRSDGDPKPSASLPTR